ncbi:MAG: NADH-quinone oxidoreductase subunit J [Actinomycetes bacterium]
MTELLSPNALEVVFALFGVVAVASSVVVVTTRHLVHAALWLVVTLGAVAACFLLMSAEFVAWMQVLIYVGAVVVIVLFGFMLTKAPIGASDDLTTENRWAALLVAVCATTVLVVLLVDGFAGEVLDLSDPSATDAKALGGAIFRWWVLPFEALSVLLLAALIGAIAVSRLRRQEA